MKTATSLSRVAILAPVVIFLAVFYVFPIGKILSLGLGQALSNPSIFSPLVETTYYIRIIFFTLWQATLSSLLTVLAALPGALLLSRYTFPGKSSFEALITIPFVLPTVVVAAAFRTLGDPQTVIGSLLALLTPDAPNLPNSLVCILAAHVFYNYSVALHILTVFWKQLPDALYEAACVNGASPFQAFRTIIIPLLAPALGAALLLVFVFCFGSFGVILLLGGYRYSTLEVEIFRQAAHIFNLPLAASLCVLQLTITWNVIRLQEILQRRSTFQFSGRVRMRPLFHASRRTRYLGSSYLCLAFAAIVLPLLSLALESFRMDGVWTLTAYSTLLQNTRNSAFFVSPLQIVQNSLNYACCATLMAVPLGLCAAYALRGIKKQATFLGPLFMLPMTTSAVTLGFGFIIALDQPPLNLRSSWFLPPIAHALTSFPFVLRAVLPTLQSMPQNLPEAAATLGAGRMKSWVTLDLPWIFDSLRIGAIYAFVMSLGEFGATVFIARPQTPTLPLAIYRFLSLPGDLNNAQAMAMSTLLMAMCVLCCVCINKNTKGRKEV